MAGIEGNDGFLQYCRYSATAIGTARWALIVVRLLVCNRFRVSLAVGKAAFGALRLRQDIVDLIC